MPITYLDVPKGIRSEEKSKLVKAIYAALHEAYPYPDDVRIFLREWRPANVSHLTSLRLRFCVVDRDLETSALATTAVREVFAIARSRGNAGSTAPRPFAEKSMFSRCCGGPIWFGCEPCGHTMILEDSRFQVLMPQLPKGEAGRLIADPSTPIAF